MPPKKSLTLVLTNTCLYLHGMYFWHFCLSTWPRGKMQHLTKSHQSFLVFKMQFISLLLALSLIFQEDKKHGSKITTNSSIFVTSLDVTFQKQLSMQIKEMKWNNYDVLYSFFFNERLWKCDTNFWKRNILSQIPFFQKSSNYNRKLCFWERCHHTHVYWLHI